MNAINRTIAFVAVAVVALGVALWTDWVTQPASVEGYENLGELFYPDFDDPTLAKSIRVVDYNEQTASARLFDVIFKDGTYRIPSHHDYPADATDQLAKTAASVIGITRGALASREKTDHERLGVIDPLDDKVTSLKGRGQRLTLLKESDEALADFIIGKPVEDRTDEYYVRRADEIETYQVALQIDLSTKFSEWIDPDLLKLERDDLVEMVATRPAVDPNGQYTGEKSRLTRASSSDDWKLDGLDEETQELKTDDVREMVSALDDLRIVGVRPKMQGITADLGLDLPAVVKQNPQLTQQFIGGLKRDLGNKGFAVAENENGSYYLASTEGEVTAATRNGVLYHLHFGSRFTGTEKEIEIGKTSDEDEKETAETKKLADKKQTDGDQQDEAEDAEDPPGENASRFLFVRVEFEPKSIGEEPVAPLEPKKPPQVEAAEKKEQEKASGDSKPEDGEKKSDGADSEQNGNTSENGGNADTNRTDEEASSVDESDNDNKDGDDDKKEGDDDKKEGDKSADKQPEKKDPTAEYEQALQEYNEAKTKYDGDKREYDEKVEKGKKQVQELNDRFQEWYYAISVDSFEKLRLSRADLVKPKEKTDDDKPGAPNFDPGKSSDNPVEAPKPPTTD